MKKTFGLNRFFKHKNVPTAQSIVDIDELIVHLDATNPTSYSGSIGNVGTGGAIRNWTNLSRDAWTQVAQDAYIQSNPYFNSKSFTFDGFDDYVSVASSGTELTFKPGVSGLDEMTIEAWIQSDYPTSRWSDEFWLSKPFNNNGEYNYAAKIDQILVKRYFNNQPVFSTLNFSSLATGNWEHIAIVFTATQWGVYRNGVVDAPMTNHNITWNEGASNQDIPLTLMSFFPYYNFGSSWNMNFPYSQRGKLHSFRLYRKALTAEQVAQNYNATKSIFYPQDIPANLVSSGLITMLDAESALSYSGSGATIIDASGNNKDGIIIGSPSFTNTSPKSFNFNAASQYIRQPQILSASNTYSMWVKYPDPTTNYPALWCSSALHRSIICGPYYDNFPPSLRRKMFAVISNLTNNDFGMLSSTTLPLNSWINLTWSWDDATKQIKFYLNGLLDFVGTYTGTIGTTHPYHYIGTEISGGSTPSDVQFLGSVANFFAYNRALSDAEVLQNYDALKSRFFAPEMPIETTNLIMHIDAAKSSSYPGFGSAVLNLAGNNSATLFGAYGLTEGSLQFYNENSGITLPSLSNIRTVSLWFKYEGPFQKYLLDARLGLQNGWVNMFGTGDGWTTAYVNGGPAVSPTWANIHPTDGAWRNVTLISSAPFTDDITLFNRFSNDEGYNAKFAVALVYSGVLTQEQNTANFNALKSRFGL